jgi:hypothetical protein
MKISDEKLIEDLKRVGDLLGKIPTGAEYEKYGKYSLFPYKSRKKWLEWCKNCFDGDTNIVLVKQTLAHNNIENLEQDLLNVYDYVKRVPSKRDYIKYGQYSVQSYIKIQSWSKWCKKVFPNFRKSNSLKISEEELANDLKQVRDKIGHVPSVNEYGKYGKYSMAVYWKVKNWENWIKDIFNIVGGKAPKKISDQDLINNLKEIEVRLHRIPRKRDLTIKNGSKYSMNAYKRAFGSFEKALLASDIKPFFVKNKSEKEVINDILVVYKKIGHTPSRKEYISHSNIGYSSPTIKKMFGSWTKFLIRSGIPVIKAKNVSKQDIIDSLKKWYKENNNSKERLEYWAIRKAKDKLKFPYSCHTIKSKFNGLPWEDIMKTIDESYKTKDPFIGRHIHIGKDGNKYLSAIEKKMGDHLFCLKNKGLIKSYEYEKAVCVEKSWTCDFYVVSNEKEFWIEIDGMNNNRRHPYGSGNNEKIEYYKENKINYIIVSYRDINIGNKIEKEIL